MEHFPWPTWSPALFVFVALWLSIFFVAAHWGGWRKLAAAYPAQGHPTGERFHMRSAQLRAGCNYSNCITFVSGPSGLRMSLPFPFGFFHAPVFIPWTELRAHESKSWLFRVVVFTSVRCPDIPIKVTKSLAERMSSACPGFEIEATSAANASAGRRIA